MKRQQGRRVTVKGREKRGRERESSVELRKEIEAIREKKKYLKGKIRE